MKAILDKAPKSECKNDADSIMKIILSFTDRERNFLLTLYKEKNGTNYVYMNTEKMTKMTDLMNEEARKYLRHYRSLGLIEIEEKTRVPYNGVITKYKFTDLFYKLFQHHDGTIKIPKLEKGLTFSDDEMLLINELYRNAPELKETTLTFREINGISREINGIKREYLSYYFLKFEKLGLIKYKATRVSRHSKITYKFTDLIHEIFQVTPTKILRKPKKIIYKCAWKTQKKAPPD